MATSPPPTSATYLLTPFLTYPTRSFLLVRISRTNGFVAEVVVVVAATWLGIADIAQFKDMGNVLHKDMVEIAFANTNMLIRDL